MGEFLQCTHTLTKIMEFLGDKVFTEAGVVALLLFWWGIYLILDNRALRRENNKLHDRVYNLGISQTEVNTETNNVLDKIVDALKSSPRRRKLNEETE